MEAAYSCMLIPPQRKDTIDKRGSYSQYTLRNQQVKQASKDMVYKAVFSANIYFLVKNKGHFKEQSG